MYESSMTYFCIPIFVLVLTIGIIFLNFSMKTTFFGFDDNAFVTTVYAQSDLSSLSPEEIREQAKDFLSTLMELRNQSTTNEFSVDESIDNSSAGGTDLVTQEFAKDVSGSYSNPSYGILDFVIPSGWYGSEKQWSGDKSISLDMQQETETEHLDRLLSPSSRGSNGENDPTMTLESNDKAELQYSQSLLGEESPVAEVALADQCKSLDGSIRFLEPNSTVTIDGKTFNVSTMECKWQTNYGSEMELGNLNDSFSNSTGRGSSTEVSKIFRYESPERFYSLQLKVSKDTYGDGRDISQNAIDIKKYEPIIDAAVQTLKIE